MESKEDYGGREQERIRAINNQTYPMLSIRKGDYIGRVSLRRQGRRILGDDIEGGSLEGVNTIAEEVKVSTLAEAGGGGGEANFSFHE